MLWAEFTFLPGTIRCPNQPIISHLTTFIFLVIYVLETAGECEFPSFLYSTRPITAPLPGPGEDQHHWVTQTKFFRNSRKWESQLEIVVLRDEITSKIKFEAQCLEADGLNVPCFHREVVYRKACIRQEGEDKYLVRSIDHGVTAYHCMKFVPRNQNVIQVWTGRKVQENKHNEHLCSDAVLERDEWPWIAPVQIEWHLCPIIGGFDFWSNQPPTNERVCPAQWRPSRFETECIMGEGMEFQFPAAECSPLEHQELSVSMQCWASWEEDGYLFIVAGEKNRTPQHIMRFPTNWLSIMEPFTIHWYLSPIAPMTKRGLPVSRFNIQMYELTTKQSEPGICYDESPLCSTYAREGRCANSALYKYANYCKRSCGLCDSLPSPRPECRFPGSYRGDWVLFENERSEQVTVSSGHITFSSLGEFTCKSRHWSSNQYKLLSRYSNGCRPRYTCMHFVQNADDALQFQISKGARSDLSFKLCHFEDDPPPLGGRIRSAHLKTLLPSSKTKGDTCGLNGLVRVSTVPNSRGQFCQGTLSDWNQRRCGSESKLQLRLKGSCPGAAEGRLEKEFVCVAYVNVEAGYSLLITKSDVVGATYQKYTCWVIKTHAERMSYKPWREAYLLNRANCGTEDDFDPTSLQKADLALQTESDAVVRPCDPDGRSNPPRRQQHQSDEADDNGGQQPSGSNPLHVKYEVYDGSDASRLIVIVTLTLLPVASVLIVTS